MIYRPAWSVNGSEEIGRGVMPSSRDPLSRSPCLTRRERCQPFLSWGRVRRSELGRSLDTEPWRSGGWRALEYTTQTPLVVSVCLDWRSSYWYGACRIFMSSRYVPSYEKDSSYSFSSLLFSSVCITKSSTVPALSTTRRRVRVTS